MLDDNEVRLKQFYKVVPRSAIRVTQKRMRENDDFVSEHKQTRLCIMFEGAKIEIHGTRQQVLDMAKKTLSNL